MNLNRRASFLSFAGAMVVAACGGGGGSKGPPLAPDPTASSESPNETALPDNPFDTADAGPVEAKADASAPSSETPASEKASVQGNEEGARALLTQFLAPNAAHAALTRSLRPTTSDYKSLFDAPTAAKVEAAQAKDWSSNKAVIKPKPGQTELKLWSATGAELAKGTGNAKEFPGGYKKIAKHLAPAATFFRFKFVEAGKETGTAYDGLAFVNGHWVIAPKPWRALEGKGGIEDDSDSTPPDAKHPPKKKPKGAKKK